MSILLKSLIFSDLYILYTLIAVHKSLFFQAWKWQFNDKYWYLFLYFYLICCKFICVYAWNEYLNINKYINVSRGNLKSTCFFVFF
jgi:hypothetical protein